MPKWKLEGGLWPLAWAVLFICLTYSFDRMLSHQTDMKILKMQQKGICL